MSARRATPILRSVLVLSLAALVVVQFAAPVWAWGGTGHRVIARLAERHLTDQAKAEIRSLLEPGESLTDASTWADEVRGQMRHTAPWHYLIGITGSGREIDERLREASFDPCLARPVEVRDLNALLDQSRATSE